MCVQFGCNAPCTTRITITKSVIIPISTSTAVAGTQFPSLPAPAPAPAAAEPQTSQSHHTHRPQNHQHRHVAHYCHLGSTGTETHDEGDDDVDHHHHPSYHLQHLDVSRTFLERPVAVLSFLLSLSPRLAGPQESLSGGRLCSFLVFFQQMHTCPYLCGTKLGLSIRRELS